MTVVLCRVDDRLVHGQVVVGWGQGIGLKRIVLADDDVARAAGRVPYGMGKLAGAARQLGEDAIAPLGADLLHGGAELGFVVDRHAAGRSPALVPAGSAAHGGPADDEASSYANSLAP